MDADAPALYPKLVDIADLKLDPNNARLHPERNVDGISKSLVKFRQRKAIVVNSRTMTIEAGNGTLEAAIAAGATQIVAVFVDDDEKTATEYAIADNRTAELAGWDNEQLKTTMESFPAIEWVDYWSGDELGAMDIEWPDVTNVEEHERDLSGGDGNDEDEDAIPDPPAEPITQVGDIIELGPHVLHCGDCIDVLRGLPDNSVDAIVTDPPYGLSPDGRARTWDEIEALRAEGKGPKAGFMGREWDAGVPGLAWARECLRVLKPGGHLVAFSATRTYHRLACAVEDAGFEIRDMIAWLQYQGFPKSLDVSRAIDKMHGAERSVVGDGPFAARRPNGIAQGSTFADDNYEWGAGHVITAPATDDAKQWAGWGTSLKPAIEPHVLARKPLEKGLTVAQNVLKWGTGALNIDACRYAVGDPAWPGPQDSSGWETSRPSSAGEFLALHKDATFSAGDLGRWPANIYACPKPSRSEREQGTDDLEARDANKWNSGGIGERRRQAGLGRARNGHPTVKPVRLMRWLLRLVTPSGGTVVEPFFGSGTTMVAACALDCKVIAAEREPAYCDIGRARVEHALAKHHPASSNSSR